MSFTVNGENSTSGIKNKFAKIIIEPVLLIMVKSQLIPTSLVFLYFTVMELKKFASATEEQISKRPHLNFRGKNHLLTQASLVLPAFNNQRNQKTALTPSSLFLCVCLRAILGFDERSWGKPQIRHLKEHNVYPQNRDFLKTESSQVKLF